MTIGKSRGPIVVLALATVLILWSPVLSQGPPMSDQTMRLERGRGPLTLRALTVAGKQVMDVRLITLALVRADKTGEKA